jgi:hypothetical protein
MQTQWRTGTIAFGFVGLAVLAVLAVLAMVPACASDDTSSGGPNGTVTDTLGNKFDVSCGGGLCGLTPRDPDIVAKSCSVGSGVEAFVLVMDPLLSIYALRVPSNGALQLNAADPSRPVACTSDADCLAPGISTGLFTFTYACNNGLCRCADASCGTDDGNLLTYDVLTLCQADLPWPSACPYVTSQPFASRISEVADLCGSKDTCAHVPPSCRQPDAPVVAPIDGGLPVGPGSAVDGGV